MSAIALLLLVCTPLLAKRYSAKGQYYTWLIVIIGFIIPFRPRWDNALINVEIPMNVPLSVQSGVHADVQSVGALPISNNALTPLVNTTISVNEPTVSLWQIGFFVWLIGLTAFLAYHCIKHYRFVNISKRWSVNITDGDILSLLQTIKSDMGIKRSIPVYLCEFTSSPMMIGVVKPRILLPKLDYTEDELYFILKHELTHYKRHDLIYRYLVLSVTALHWFNPIVYFVAKHIHNLCETSCDEEVLKSTSMDKRRSYCETIFTMAQKQS
jgi:beta-lactamase regulating signal transducer with metallopeptidase domain